MLGGEGGLCPRVIDLSVGLCTKSDGAAVFVQR